MLPRTASIATYGGSLNDYSARSDSTTDRSAVGVNPAYCDLAGMTHTAVRAWARVTLKSAGTAPVLAQRDEVWNNATPGNPAPTPARSSAGVFTLTYPATVQDEIPMNSPGYSGPVAVNLRASWATDRGGSTWGSCRAVVTAPNVITLYFFKLVGGAPTLGDPAADTDVDVFSI